MRPQISLVLYAFLARSAFTKAADAVPNATPVGTLYAYGQNISGLPLFYADGLALLGYGQPEDISEAVNVTFTSSTTATTLKSSPNNTAMATNWTQPLLYIDATAGSFTEAGFTSLTNTSYTTTGFSFWGRQLMWLGNSDDGSVGRSFWAAPRGNDGVWSLLWNSDNAASETAVPIVLKRQPPPSLDKN